MAEDLDICTVAWQIATYSGVEIVYCDPNDDNEEVIGKAKRQVRRKFGTFPFGYESWNIKTREPYDGRFEH